MVLGFTITGPIMVAGGLTLITLLALQVLIGLRVIKLGRKHFVYHKWLGISILTLAAFHGVLGLAFGLGLAIL